MNSILSLKEKLRPLNLYNLNNQGILNAELSAYAFGFDLIYSDIETLECECFISTAESYGLQKREQLFSYKRDGLDVAKRREMLLYRGAITSNDFTKSKIEEALISSGIRATITEDFENNEITVDCTEIFDTLSSQSEAIEMAEKFLPAHLTSNFEFE